MAEYMPVTVEAARQIANTFQKHIIVIVSVDHQHDKTHFTTYGRYPEDKIVAAHLGDAIAEATGHALNQSTNYEDFRTVDAAGRAAVIEQLAKVAKACDYAISSLLAVRTGLTDEFLLALQAEIRAALDSKNKEPKL